MREISPPKVSLFLLLVFFPILIKALSGHFYPGSGVVDSPLCAAIEPVLSSQDSFCFMDKGCQTHCEPLCPQASPQADPVSGVFLSAKSFAYQYRDSAFDPGSSGIYRDQASDGKNILRLDSLLVQDESEFCLFQPLCNGPWANFWMKVAVIWADPACQRWEGEARYQCNYLKSLGEASEIDFNHKLHVGGPLLSPKGHCEFYDHKLLGAQKMEYQNFIVWDWDNWLQEGKKAYALHLLIYESDEGIWDDRLISVRIQKDHFESQTFSSGYLSLHLTQD